MEALRRRFINTNGDDELLKSRLASVLDEEFYHGIIFDDEEKGVGKGLGRILLERNLFPEEDVRALGMDIDGLIREPSQKSRFGHSSAYFALLQMRWERRKAMSGDEGLPTELGISLGEIEHNRSTATYKKDEVAKVLKRKGEGKIVKMGGKKYLFVKPLESAPYEPQLDQFYFEEVDETNDGNMNRTRTENSCVKSEDWEISEYLTSKREVPIRGCYFIFTVDEKGNRIREEEGFQISSEGQ